MMNSLRSVAESVQRPNSEINLEFTGYGYKWVGKSVPKSMQGLWLNPEEAVQASKSFEKELAAKAEHKAKHVNAEITDLEQLDILTRKHELLDFAESRGLEVPSDIKQPSKIKKLLKETLEEANA